MVRYGKYARVAGALVATTAMFYASNASALQVSDFFTGYKGEMKVIMPVVLLLIAAAGVFFAGWGIISSITTKKQQQPLTWQLFAIFGGACAIVVPVILVAAGGSITSGNGDASSTLSELGIDY